MVSMIFDYTNLTMLHESRNIDALIRAMKLCPTETLRDHLIDLEIDQHGRWVGFDLANSIWHRAYPDLPCVA